MTEAKTTAKILVVEDDSHTRMLLETILKKEGYEVVSTANGAEALGKLESCSGFDLVLSDWLMPEMDGLDLCGKIKADEILRQIYFIILSSKDLSEEKVRALDSGVDDYLSKPFDHSELVARVRAGLRVRELQKEVLALERSMTVIQLATAAGHEINNPLTGLIGFLDLLRDGIETGEPREKILKYIDHLSAEAERIRHVVSRLVSLTHFQTKPYLGKQQMIDLTGPSSAAVTPAREDSLQEEVQ